MRTASAPGNARDTETPCPGQAHNWEGRRRKKEKDEEKKEEGKEKRRGEEDGKKRK